MEGSVDETSIVVKPPLTAGLGVITDGPLSLAQNKRMSISLCSKKIVITIVVTIIITTFFFEFLLDKGPYSVCGSKRNVGGY